MKSHKALVAIMAAIIISAVIVLIVMIRSDKHRDAGVLEFRIAPTLPGSGSAIGTELTETEYETYMSQLAGQGPTTRPNQDEKYLWFPIRNTCRMLAPNLIVGKRGDKKYILLFNQPEYTMLNDPRNPSWSVSSAHPERDERGKPSVYFNLDERGARLMALLTGAHKGHFLAILVSDEVYSAPVLRSTIYNSGVIGGNFTVAEVDKLIRTLEDRSLPSSNQAGLRKTPTSSPAPTN